MLLGNVYRLLACNRAFLLQWEAGTDDRSFQAKMINSCDNTSTCHEVVFPGQEPCNSTEGSHK
jgi:hypothetical protein